MLKTITIGISIVTIITGSLWGWLGATLFLTIIALFLGLTFMKQEGEITVPELTIGVAFHKKGNKFARFLEPGTHWINPMKEEVTAFIKTSGQSASGRTTGAQAIGGLPLEIEWTIAYTLKPQKLSAEARPKMARALPDKAAKIAQQQINNCWHHLVGDYTIEQLTEPGAHRRLERHIRQLVQARLQPLGFEVSRIMIEAIHLPKQVQQALESAHEREMQAEKEAKALERLQKVVSQFSEADMARLVEIERLHILGKQGFAMVYPETFVSPYDGRQMGQAINVTPKMAT